VETIDCVVVGAGVVGLASALAIARRGQSVCVLEREARPGLGTSTHNSQVIHAGLYYPRGSLKARHCVEGARLLFEYCERNSVPFRRSGKLVIAHEAHEEEALEQLYARGTENGVPGLRLVDAGFIRALEPHIAARAALHSSATGIVDAEALVRTLTRQCVELDAFVLPGSPLLGVEAGNGGLTIRTPSERIVARAVVNAAGLYADEVSNLAGGEPFAIHPCRGEYAELVPAMRGMVSGLVYPVPQSHGHSLGVHLTKTVHGNVTLGPTVRFQTRKDDYESERMPVEAFLESARRLLPALRLEDLRLGGSGIRPKLHGPEVSFADFLIERDARQPRLVQASGIESPGLTACLSIGEHVAALVAEILS
jgi:L-2-hydroxyglutarate oxidase LhgO